MELTEDGRLALGYADQIFSLTRIFHASRTPGQNHLVFDADEHPARE
jgi:hypothetical protein